MNVFNNLRLPSWVWSALGSLVLLAFVFTRSHELNFGIVTANLTAASFLTLVGIGQMFPIATGEGGIDLSIPFVMNFCAFLSIRLITGQPSSVALVVLVAIAFGAMVGFINGTIVIRLRVPPIIGTLAVGLIVLTFVEIISATGSTTIVDRQFTDFIRGSFLGVPTPTFIALALAVVVAIVIRYSPFGWSLLAIGQSRRAAWLAGINVNRTVFFAYVVSGAVAGLTGVLLAASVGSADLELGNPYLLTSVGAVVLGGNRIAGGTASVVGTAFGALLLSLLIVAVTVAGLPIEAKNIATGLVITVVLIAANAPEAHSRVRKFPLLSFIRKVQ